MEIKVTLHDIIIKDMQSGEERMVRTLRSVQEIACFIEETENEEILDRLREELRKAY